MKTVAFFNNKGGVGKTTLTCNVAAHFALRSRKRVLLIDCDPQCNATQLILPEEQIDNLYWTNGGNHEQTILKVLYPIQTGDAGIDTNIVPLLGTSNRFGLDLIPGHPQLSVIEDQLGQAWTNGQSGAVGGLGGWPTLICFSVWNF